MAKKERRASVIYRIRVQGHLDSRWSDWFDGFSIQYWKEGTVLFGSVPDQAALHGVLAKIWDLGLTILLVENLSDKVTNATDDS